MNDSRQRPPQAPTASAARSAATSASDPIADLVRELGRLPGIGEKTASRLTYHLLRSPPQYARALAAAIEAVVERIRPCSICCNLTEREPCPICADPHRDGGLVCAVSGVPDLLAIERAGSYRGVYHVLHGTLSPLDGVGPRDIRAQELVKRLASGAVRELVLATSPTAEGEATAVYLANEARPHGIRVTRIATGLPMGGDLEYSDRMTLARALEARHEM